MGKKKSPPVVSSEERSGSVPSEAKQTDSEKTVSEKAAAEKTVDTEKEVESHIPTSPEKEADVPTNVPEKEAEVEIPVEKEPAADTVTATVAEAEVPTNTEKEAEVEIPVEKETAADKETETEAESEESEKAAETDSDGSPLPLAYPPNAMYISTEWYNETMKIATNCYISETVKNLEEILDKDEMKWFYNHSQFRHFFHMPREVTHKTMGFFLLLLRSVKTMKKNEVWFLVNGVPIRYGMKEHALISGLDCREYPDGYQTRGDLKFVDRHFKKKKCTDAAVKEKFLGMKKKSRDRLNMGILYFLTRVMKGNAKRGSGSPESDEFLRKAASDADFCETFPWGRYTFFDNLYEIRKLLNKMDGKVMQSHVNFPGFITSLELLAFEAIPALADKYREGIEIEDEEELDGCPRMCKTKFKHCEGKGWPISDLHTTIGETKVCY